MCSGLKISTFRIDIQHSYFISLFKILKRTNHLSKILQGYFESHGSPPWVGITWIRDKSRGIHPCGAVKLWSITVKLNVPTSVSWVKQEDFPLLCSSFLLFLRHPAPAVTMAWWLQKFPSRQTISYYVVFEMNNLPIKLIPLLILMTEKEILFSVSLNLLP